LNEGATTRLFIRLLLRVKQPLVIDRAASNIFEVEGILPSTSLKAVLRTARHRLPDRGRNFGAVTLRTAGGHL